MYIPGSGKYTNNILLVLRHIYNRNAGLASLKIISDSTNTSSAILYDIPNQPLFDGREEDDLQAYSFSQYIKTGDESWPLLFPMVKSVVRAMDAIQNIIKKESKLIINRFVIAGHSKRGHTTWLTAAIDPRIKGIIPIAIDVLNSEAQLPHHLETFGDYSTPSKAATDFLKELKLPRGKNLIRMVDPYSYRKQLTLPKLIVSATNDDFFTTDALNLYWNGLTGPKWILYLSNANHVQADADPRINTTAFAFVRAIAMNKLLPTLSWEFKQTKGRLFLRVMADKSAIKASVWLSYSENKDFRKSAWVSKSMKQTDTGTFSMEFEMDIKKPSKGYVMIFSEVEFRENDSSFLLSTQTYLSSAK